VKSAWILLIVTLAAQASSAETVAVGNCRPGVTSYATISLAVAVATAGATVLVCPGTYPEQVTITTPLTLRGLSLVWGSNPVITVPVGGFAAEGGAQILAQGNQFNFTALGPVNISNLIVDGTGSGVNCASGTLTGIEYSAASGTIENVQVRNQNPGGCGSGILLGGGEAGIAVNILNSSVDNFDSIGIQADALIAGGEVNLTSNSIGSTSASVQAGAYLFGTQSIIARNTIVLSAGSGLELEDGPMTAKNNTIVGTNTGIVVGGTPSGDIPIVVTHNSLYGNAIGIGVNPFAENVTVGSNAISQSTTAAIQLECGGYGTAVTTTVEHNEIFAAPIGIANIDSLDKVAANTFYSVPTATTTCP